MGRGHRAGGLADQKALGQPVVVGFVPLHVGPAPRHRPAPHPLLCVEEPQNQLYPTLLWELAEQFRAYAHRGGQVFVSTHSPDFLNAARREEVFWLQKEGGYTTIRRASEDAQGAAYMRDGDQMGYLQGFFEGAAPGG